MNQKACSGSVQWHENVNIVLDITNEIIHPVTIYFFDCYILLLIVIHADEMKM